MIRGNHSRLFCRIIRFFLVDMVISSSCCAAFFARLNSRNCFHLKLSITRTVALTMASKNSSFVVYDEASSLKSGVAQIDKYAPPTLRKYHHLTICVVPPETSEIVWEAITKCRTQLRDPGLFRWPPHANLLYPFLDIRPPNAVDADDACQDRTMINQEIIEGLIAACCQCEPFHVQLKNFGTFGSKQRGVLWLLPDSSCNDEIGGGLADPPLMRLQSLLVEAFPTCIDQNKKSVDGFNPHMTVSHFINLDEALAAQNRVQEWWPADLSFPVNCIYLMQRLGDSGQFLRVADISLGANAIATVHASPISFRHMPETEDDWVLAERMKLKKRRNGKGQRRDGRSRSTSSRTPDSPEVVEAKRAERKAKRDEIVSTVAGEE